MTELPPLTGRPEIVKLANNDRTAKLAQLDQQVRDTADDAPAELVDGLAALYRDVALRQTDAGWWITDRPEMLARIIRREFTADDNARIAGLAAQR